MGEEGSWRNVAVNTIQLTFTEYLLRGRHLKWTVSLHPSTKPEFAVLSLFADEGHVAQRGNLTYQGHTASKRPLQLLCFNWHAILTLHRSQGL